MRHPPTGPHGQRIFEKLCQARQRVLARRRAERNRVWQRRLARLLSRIMTGNTSRRMKQVLAARDRLPQWIAVLDRPSRGQKMNQRFDDRPALSVWYAGQYIGH